MTSAFKKNDVWKGIAIVLLLMFILFFVYPIVILLKEAVWTAEGGFTLDNFAKFLSKPYYAETILRSFKISIWTMILSLIIGIPFAYFPSFYNLKGSKLLFTLCMLCGMSAPFIGAYSWIMLLGRNGLFTRLLEGILGVSVGSIYGLKGILLVETLELYPLIFIYMQGAFKNIDNSLMEASHNLGCTGVKRFFKILLMLSMPTILAAALLVFMRSFADFGTPLLIGEGYRTFTVEVYKQFINETGTDFGFASALSIIAIILTAAIFLIQKYATNKFKFSINALHPIQKKDPKGISGVLMHLFCYAVAFIGFIPQLYIIIVSFRNYKGSIQQPGYSLNNYKLALDKLLGRSIVNTAFIGVVALILIVLIAILIAYLVVRRSGALSNTIDTISMIPYIVPGTVVGIAMVLAFNRQPLVLTGTFAIMIITLVIRRMPYATRSTTAVLMQIPLSIEEASISLGASKMKTFFQVTVPMMKNGIISGAILSWVSLITEVASAVILYNNRTITLTMSTYAAVLRGTEGLAAAFASITTVFTVISVLVYLSRTDEVNL